MLSTNDNFQRNEDIDSDIDDLHNSPVILSICKAHKRNFDVTPMKASERSSFRTMNELS